MPSANSFKPNFYYYLTSELIHCVTVQYGSNWTSDFMFRPILYYPPTVILSWWRGSVVERRSLAGELSLSCARPAADG